MKGAGDLIEKAIKIVYPNSRPCKGCQKRKELLNKVLPFHVKQDKQRKSNNAKA